MRFYVAGLGSDQAILGYPFLKSSTHTLAGAEERLEGGKGILKRSERREHQKNHGKAEETSDSCFMAVRSPASASKDTHSSSRALYSR
jgi:hypothetical protein